MRNRFAALLLVTLAVTNGCTTAHQARISTLVGLGMIVGGSVLASATATDCNCDVPGAGIGPAAGIGVGAVLIGIPWTLVSLVAAVVMPDSAQPTSVAPARPGVGPEQSPRAEVRRPPAASPVPPEAAPADQAAGVIAPAPP